ncbi:hypothetical protein E2C01_056417 [Portunus trituberculatus]|uniref:Uncharacterized protein n=1 Tax=Portunus trituberculatus TaxID=210409 RepID=A0A5B7GXC0_PORTR|nr:hypothetical protein [Portunus trituberculatus]
MHSTFFHRQERIKLPYTTLVSHHHSSKTRLTTCQCRHTCTNSQNIRLSHPFGIYSSCHCSTLLISTRVPRPSHSVDTSLMSQPEGNNRVGVFMSHVRINKATVTCTTPSEDSDVDGTQHHLKL